MRTIRAAGIASNSSVAPTASNTGRSSTNTSLRSTPSAVALTAERDDGDGWRVTRPLVFLAHHLCEVALKAALGRGGYSNNHDLVQLWAVLGPKTPWGEDSAVSAWIGEVLKEMNGVTARGFEGRLRRQETR